MGNDTKRIKMYFHVVYGGGRRMEVHEEIVMLIFNSVKGSEIFKKVFQFLGLCHVFGPFFLLHPKGSKLVQLQFLPAPYQF